MKKFLIFFINLLTFFTFIFYYGPQILRTNPLLWVFVPDCQISALLIGLSMYIKRLRFIASAMAFKYGLWTMIIVWAFKLPFSLFITHLFLFVESFLISGKPYKISISYLFLNDFSDYFLGTHPYLPYLTLNIPILAFTLSFLSIFFASRKASGGN